MASLVYVPKKTSDKNYKRSTEKGLGLNIICLTAKNDVIIKKKIPIFKTWSHESFLNTMEMIHNLITEYPELTADENITNTISQIKDCFAG